MYFPEFSITTGILNNIGKIEAAKAVIEHTPLAPAHRRGLQREAEALNMYHANHFEGNPITLEHAKAFYDGKNIDHAPRVLKELENYRKAWSTIYDPAEVNEDLLKILHRTLLGDGVTIYRAVATGYPVTPLKAAAPDEILAQLRRFLSWFESTDARELPNPLRSAILYFEILRIQPFETENKKIAGLLAADNLALNNYDEIRLIPLERYFDESPSAFHAAIRATQNDQGDITRWIEYFLEGLAREYTTVKNSVLSLMKDIKVRKLAGGAAVNERQERILEYLHDYGRMQNRDFVRLFPHVSEDTILRDLKNLAAKGLIVKKGSTKSATYESAEGSNQG